MRTDRDADATDDGDATGSTEVVEGGDVDSLSTVDEPTTDLTARERAALRRVRGLGTLLDDAVRVPGTNFRVGADPILGILPVGGDAVATVFALYPIVEAVRFGLPTSTILKMILLVAVDGVVGSIPVLGTVFDAFWKANKWNAKTVQRHLEGA